MTDLNESASDQPAEAPRPVRAGGEAIDTRTIRKLADILKDTDLTSIEVERGDLKIRVARELPAVATSVIAPPGYAPAPTQAAPPSAAAVAAPPIAPMPGASASAPDAPARGDLVKSPMVGTVYLQPQPDAAPFVKVGDQVSAGQTLLIVEAMKTMNPIPAPRSGTLLELLVGDGQPVEYGEPLAVIG